MNTEAIAWQIFLLTGPASNILTVNHCMTRLRLTLKNIPPDLKHQLNQVDGILGVNITNQELQIILGPGRVEKVTTAFLQLMPTPATSLASSFGDGKDLHAKIRAKNATPLKLFFKRIASIFIPLIPAFIACGLISGLLNISGKLFPDLTFSPFFQLLTVAGNVIFWSMNLFVGFNTAKEFGGTPIIGGILGGLLSHPGLAAVTLGVAA